MKQEHLNSVAMSGLFKYIDGIDHETAWSELGMAVRSFSDGQIIYQQDESVSRAAIVHSGLVKGERLHFEGTSNLAYLYMRGDIFAFEGAVSGKKTSPLQLTAQGAVEAVFFDVRLIFSSAFEKQLVTGLLELLANDDIKKLYRIEILAQRGLRSRILSYLNVLSARFGSDTFRLDMSREQLAQYLCVNRSALSYELNEMKRDGIIDFDRRNVRLL